MRGLLALADLLAVPESYWLLHGDGGELRAFTGSTGAQLKVENEQRDLPAS